MPASGILKGAGSDSPTRQGSCRREEGGRKKPWRRQSRVSAGCDEECEAKKNESKSSRTRKQEHAETLSISLALNSKTRKHSDLLTLYRLNFKI